MKMKMKKLTALVSAFAMMMSLAPMSMAAKPASFDLDLGTTDVKGNVDVRLDLTDTYKDSVTLEYTGERTFDFIATLNMANVVTKFSEALTEAGKLQNFDQDRLNKREVEGKFTVTVKPGSYIQIPDADKTGKNMYGFKIKDGSGNWVAYDESTGLYKETKRTMDGNNLVITVALNEGTTVEDIAAANALADLAYESTGVKVTRWGTTTIAGNVSGSIWTKDIDGVDTDRHATAAFVSASPPELTTANNPSSNVFACQYAHNPAAIVFNV